MKHIKWIINAWRPHLGYLPILFVLTLVSAAAAVAFPWVIGWAIDEFNAILNNPSTANNKTVNNLLLALLGIGIVRSFSHLYPATRAMVNLRIDMKTRERYFGYILEKGYRFFNKFRTGDLVTRLTADINDFPRVAWFTCSGIFRAVESSAKLILCITAMLLIHWQLTLLSIIPMPIMVYLFYVVRIQLTKRARANQDAISRTNETLESCFGGVRILKAYNGVNQQAGLFERFLKERIEIEMRWQTLWIIIHQLFWGVNIVGQFIVVIVGGYYVINGSLSIGMAVSFYLYHAILLHPLMDIPNLFATSRQAFVCIDRLEEINDAEDGIEGQMDGTEPIPQMNYVELNNVRFKYTDDGPYVLDGVDIKIPAGIKAAVVGPVGSGKSTLMKIIAGMLPPTEGTMNVNGRSIDDYIRTEYRALTGYIPQEPILFSESVRDNVDFGRKIDEDGIRKSLQQAQIDEEVEGFADGVDQMLGQRGLSVSGGQKQRIAIARALAGKPQLLLMDDCTSALDAENEEGFWRMFEDEFPDAACLIVTHRLATAKRADVIYVIDEGRIVGMGTHNELIKNCREYREFQTRIELESSLKIK